MFWYILFPFLALSEWLMTALAFFFVNWWCPITARYTTYSDKGLLKSGFKLPPWLCWFDTFDADLDEGVRSGLVQAKTLFGGRVLWLYRNIVYGYGYWALGAEFKAENWVVIKHTQTPTSLFFYAVDTATGRFNLHCNISKVRLKLGWKAWNYWQGDTKTWSAVPFGPLMRVPFTASISKFQ